MSEKFATSKGGAISISISNALNLFAPHKIVTFQSLLWQLFVGGQNIFDAQDAKDFSSA